MYTKLSDLLATAKTHSLDFFPGTVVAKSIHHVRRFFYRRTVRQLSPLSSGIGAHGQDLFIAKLLGYRRDGVFVDIGASDGVTISNTLYFERELGWTGLAVEPLPGVFQKLQANRRCHTLNAGVSDRNGRASFVEVVGAANMLSGLQEKMDPRHQRRIRKNIKRQGGSVRAIEVEVITWAAALQRFGIERVDFLSLDTEGGELGILKSIGFEKTPISVISVENNYFTHDMSRLLELRGFERCGAFGVDEIYRHKKLVPASA